MTNKLTLLTDIVDAATDNAIVSNRLHYEDINDMDQVTKVYLLYGQTTGGSVQQNSSNFVYPFFIESFNDDKDTAMTAVETVLEEMIAHFRIFKNTSILTTNPAWIRILTGNYRPFNGEMVRYTGLLETQWMY